MKSGTTLVHDIEAAGLPREAHDREDVPASRVLRGDEPALLEGFWDHDTADDPRGSRPRPS